jgi:hypothetical protein
MRRGGGCGGVSEVGEDAGNVMRRGGGSSGCGGASEVGEDAGNVMRRGGGSGGCDVCDLTDQR